MNCPKCNYAQNGENTECEKCGIIFAKYLSALNSKPRTTQTGISGSSPTDDQPSMSFGNLFFFTKAENTRIYFYGRLILFLFLVLWGIRFVFSSIENNYAGHSFMHLVNLPFHEAGHIFLRPLGHFMTSLGGTIGQMLMPLTCCAVLLIKTRDTFGAAVTLWWFGQNFFDIAPYVNDARSLSLPLVGGNFGYSSPYGFHDWEFILTETGLLQYDHFIAKLCVTTGMAIFLISYVWGGILLFKQYNSHNE